MSTARSESTVAFCGSTVVRFSRNFHTLKIVTKARRRQKLCKCKIFHRSKRALEMKTQFDCFLNKNDQKTIKTKIAKRQNGTKDDGEERWIFTQAEKNKWFLSKNGAGDKEKTFCLRMFHVKHFAYKNGPTQTKKRTNNPCMPVRRTINPLAQGVSLISPSFFEKCCVQQ